MNITYILIFHLGIYFRNHKASYCSTCKYSLYIFHSFMIIIFIFFFSCITRKSVICICILTGILTYSFGNSSDFSIGVHHIKRHYKYRHSYNKQAETHGRLYTERGFVRPLIPACLESFHFFIFKIFIIRGHTKPPFNIFSPL